MNSICYTNTKHISYESKVTIHHLFSNFISEVYALDTNSYVKQEAAEKRVDNLLQKRRKSEYVKTKECTEKQKVFCTEPDGKSNKKVQRYHFPYAV